MVLVTLSQGHNDNLNGLGAGWKLLGVDDDSSLYAYAVPNGLSFCLGSLGDPAVKINNSRNNDIQPKSILWLPWRYANMHQLESWSDTYR